MKTIFVNTKEVERKWWLVDADGQTLGRLASRIAHVLRGKNKPAFVPHQEVGDWVVVVNAEKIRVTGKKLTDKIYYRFTGWAGGVRQEPLGRRLARRPTFPVEQAIKGMLPKGPLGRKLFKNVKVYAGPSHPHAAQKPQKIEL
jgi:large subunit ribosomal protein L13